jgi:hypothetical protein
MRRGRRHLSQVQGGISALVLGLLGPFVGAGNCEDVAAAQAANSVRWRGYAQVRVTI